MFLHEDENLSLKISNLTDSATSTNITKPWVTIIVISVFVPTSFAFGVVGNILVLFVFGKELKRTKKASNLLIVLMGSVDVVTCSVVVISGTFTLILGEEFPQGALLSYELVMACGVYCSMFLCQMMAVDRYTAVCTPHANFLTRRRIVKVSVVCFLVSAVLAICSIIKPIERYYNLAQIGFVTYLITGVVMSSLYTKMWRELFKNNIQILDANVHFQLNQPLGGASGHAWATRQPYTASSLRSSHSNNALQTSDSQNLYSKPGISPASLQRLNTITIGHSSNRVVIQDRTAALVAGHPEGARASTLTSRNGQRRYMLVRRLVITFFVITLLFMLSWIPMWLFHFGIVSEKARIIIFVNNFLNPIVYFLSNAKFRTSTVDYLSCKTCKRRYS